MKYICNLLYRICFALCSAYCVSMLACDYGAYSCDSDSDCPNGNHCSVENGVCVPFPRPNNAPQIIAVKASTSFVAAPNTISVLVQAQDPDGDPLQLFVDGDTDMVAVEIPPFETVQDHYETTMQLRFAKKVSNNHVALSVRVEDEPPAFSALTDSQWLLFTVYDEATNLVFVDGKHGDDAASGSQDSPVQSIRAALNGVDGTTEKALILVAGDVVDAQSDALAYEEPIRTMDYVLPDKLTLMGGYCHNISEHQWHWDASECPSLLQPKAPFGDRPPLSFVRETEHQTVVFSSFTIIIDGNERGAEQQQMPFLAIDMGAGRHEAHGLSLTVRNVQASAVRGISTNCVDKINDTAVVFKNIEAPLQQGLLFTDVEFGAVIDGSSFQMNEYTVAVQARSQALILSHNRPHTDCPISDGSSFVLVRDSYFSAGSGAVGVGFMGANLPASKFEHNKIYGPTLYAHQQSHSLGALLLGRSNAVSFNHNEIQARGGACSAGVALVQDGQSWEKQMEKDCFLEAAMPLGTNIMGNYHFYGNTIQGNAANSADYAVAFIAQGYALDLFANGLHSGKGRTAAVGAALQGDIRAENNVIVANQAQASVGLLLQQLGSAVGFENKYSNNYIASGSGEQSSVGVWLKGELKAGYCARGPKFINNIIELKAVEHRIAVREAGLRPSLFVNNMISWHGNEAQVDEVLYLAHNDLELQALSQCQPAGEEFFAIMAPGPCLENLFELSCKHGIDACLWISDDAVYAEPLELSGEVVFLDDSPLVDRGSWLGASCDKAGWLRSCRRPDLGPYEYMQFDCQLLSCAE